MSDQPVENPVPAGGNGGGINLVTMFEELRARVEQLEKDRGKRWNPRRETVRDDDHRPAS